MKKKSFIFTTLAMNQTLFFEKICQQLISEGHSAEMICFHERSHEYLVQKNVTSHNVFDHITEQSSHQRTAETYTSLIKKHGMPESNFILSHEVESFGLTFDDVKFKFVNYLFALESVLEDIKSKHTNNTLIMIQELGGFSSIISSFYVCKTFGIRNYFLEPSFFKGRVFIIPDSFEALKVSELANSVDDAVHSYLDDVTKNQKIVIPDKDKAHYFSLFSKIFRFHNFKRLFIKFIDKYIFGKKEEFSYIFKYSLRHGMMLVNKFRQKKLYTEIPEQPFVYYPLHVPMDVALTVRSPHCLDQYALIDLICRSVDHNMTVAFKEHPAMVGVMNPKKCKDLLKKNQNLVMLNPGINNYKIIEKAQALLTVNSKAGAEALMLGKKVIVLGDAFYSNCSLVYKHADFSNLSNKIRHVLGATPPDKADVKKFFQSTWNKSSPGEIYSLKNVDINHFCQAFNEL
jgi:hypothetical protein